VLKKKIPLKTLTNKEAEALHARQVKALKTRLGNVPLTDGTITTACKAKKIPLMGVFMQNNPIPSRDGMFVMNNDTIGNAGIHWVGGVKIGKTIYIYDSFGRSNTKLLPIFTQMAKQQGYRIRNAGLNDQDQFGETSVDCGHRVISSLMIAKKYGVNSFMKL
jgi:hypothetical protein